MCCTLGVCWLLYLAVVCVVLAEAKVQGLWPKVQSRAERSLTEAHWSCSVMMSSLNASYY